MTIIAGKTLAQKIKLEIKEKVAKLKVKPGLAAVLVGKDPASKIYVDSKEKACQEIGYYSKKIVLPKATTQRQLNSVVEQLNKNPRIHGFLVQLPLPSHLSEVEVLAKINPEKDVDGLSPINMGRLFSVKKITDDLLIPCTARGVMKLIKSTGRPIEGKQAVVLGRSNLVGKTVSLLLLSENATVTICHSKTQSLAGVCQKADILVAAIGKPKFVMASMVKKGAMVIDVGINSIKGKIVGDVDFEEVKNVAGFITPVPGGVGPMTIACLMENTLIAYFNQMSKPNP